MENGGATGHATILLYDTTVLRGEALYICDRNIALIPVVDDGDDSYLAIP